jgi:hypothetical protein
MRHEPDISAHSIVIDGQEWVPRSAYDAVMEKLREKQRSTASHNHQFAEIHDLWANLPHSHAQAPYAASAEAFRKHGLIATGHCDTQTVSFASKADAMAAAPFIADLARKAHGYALTVVRGPLVICSTPHSQSYKAMGKDLFHKSKSDVLDWGHALLGVTP